MLGRRVATIIKRFARHRDDVRLLNFQRVRGLDLALGFLVLTQASVHQMRNKA